MVLVAPLIRAALAGALTAVCVGAMGGCRAAKEEPARGPLRVVPPVISLDVRQGDRAAKYTPGEQGRRFVVSADGPALDLSVSSEGNVAWVQYLITGQGPGHDGQGTWVVAEGPGGHVVEWLPRPGTRGTLQAVVWHTNGAAVRSPQGEVVVPMPPDLFCPTVTLPPAPPVEGVDWRSVPDFADNLLLVDWLGRSYFIPLTADPETCLDAKVKEILLSAQAEAPSAYRGLGATVRKFVENGRLHGVPAERFWLAQARLAGSDQAGVSVYLRMVEKGKGMGRQVEAIVRAVARGGGWAVVGVEDMRVLGRSVQALASRRAAAAVLDRRLHGPSHTS